MFKRLGPIAIQLGESIFIKMCWSFGVKTKPKDTIDIIIL